MLSSTTRSDIQALSSRWLERFVYTEEVRGSSPRGPILKKGFTMSNKKPESRIGARDSKNGQFIRLKEAEKRPATTQKERIPLPGNGDTGRGKKK